MSAEETVEKLRKLREELKQKGMESGVSWVDQRLEDDEKETNQNISEEYNFRQAMLVDSQPQITNDYPTLFLNTEHSEFDPGQSGMARVMGTNISGERTRTSYIGFYAAATDSNILPEQRSEHPEAIIESDQYDFMPHKPISYTVVPSEILQVSTGPEDGWLENYEGNLNYVNKLIEERRSS